jgi:hypothetical protein
VTAFVERTKPIWIYRISGVVASVCFDLAIFAFFARLVGGGTVILAPDGQAATPRMGWIALCARRRLASSIAGILTLNGKINRRQLPAPNQTLILRDRMWHRAPP